MDADLARLIAKVNTQREEVRRFEAQMHYTVQQLNKGRKELYHLEHELKEKQREHS